eukprot:TRINITY_DN13824_c0_g1_i4.p1 TRINITY_DN13824_c0_g1~~TRINITY_DN13824_c0_g1_i4.p1  ORF type:complete len:147 (-),score=26.88 TRINITY_DN13824_c0_g1_i4:14-454(-)
MFIYYFFFNDTATTEIYTLHIVGSVRCVQETGYQRRVHGKELWVQIAKMNLMSHNKKLGKQQEQKKAIITNDFRTSGCILHCIHPVSYTHLTLPTICSVQISVVAVSLKKKQQINMIQLCLSRTLYCRQSLVTREHADNIQSPRVH